MKKTLLVTTSLALSLAVLPAFSLAAAPAEKQLDTYKIEQELAAKEVKKPKREKATKVYNDAYKELDFTFKDAIFKDLQAQEQNNPTASEDEVNEYFMGLTKKYRSTNTPSPSADISFSIMSVEESFYTYVNGQVQLNSQEQALYNSNPSKGFKALMAGDEALSYTKYKFGVQGHNDKADAFRHEAWNIWIMAYVDYNWAYDWTTAHEEGATNQPAMEKEMDLNNNSIGRIYGLSNNISSSSTVVSTRATIVSAYKSGSLKCYWANGGGFDLRYFTGADSDFINTAN